MFSVEEIQEISVSLHETTRNVYKLLENLLEWARLQKGSMPLNPDSFDMYSIVKSNFEIVQPKANLKNVKLLNNIPLSLQVFADVNMINTVIRNLISNSLKFTNDTGTITINYRDLDNFHHIDIIDDGVGMSKSVLNKLFKIDEHVTTLGTNQETGTGLGLILCKELVNKNKGNIIVESELGKGTKFTITIPKNLEELLAPHLN
jgi:two-component system sensor histidine kinase/response regulator